MDINTLYKKRYIDRIDLALAQLIVRISGDDDHWVALASALVSRAAHQGHVCLDLAVAIEQGIEHPEGLTALPITIALDQWQAHLQQHPAVGEPDDQKPLILENQRLYLHRYWTYEKVLAQCIADRCQNNPCLDSGVDLQVLLQRFFPNAYEDDQRQAAYTAVTRSFCVISGGPGTGKTHTIARIIAILQILAQDSPLRIKLATPTGKAAARLQEAVEVAAQSIDMQTLLADSAQTIHRLLKPVPNLALFQHDAANLLPADVVIVDEASMVDLALMAKLIKALPAAGRLILVGDKDQLASVEAGAVMGDICYGASQADQCQADKTFVATPKKEDGILNLGQHIAILHKNYRFDTRSGIGALSRTINTGDTQKVRSLLSSKKQREIKWQPWTNGAELAKLLEREILAHIAPLFQIQDPAQIFIHLSRFQILTPLRKGPYGVRALNAFTEKTIQQQGLIARHSETPSTWYSGRPVMITRNDYFHELFNGDIGIAVQGDQRNMYVAFAAAKGQIRYLTPHQLPPHETVYAMTVHKSQGSEFDRVILILPDQDAPVLTRELIYTAITRARTTVEIWGDLQILEAAIHRRTRRSSGLSQKLWPDISCD